jgi:hypothetical protein
MRAVLLTIFLLLVPLQLWSATLPTKGEPLLVDAANKRILIYAEVNGRNLETSNPHWGIVAVGGRLADKGILRSFAAPLALHDALLKLGARPGDNLTAGSSGQFVAGDHLEVTVTWPGLGRELPLAAIFDDETGKGFHIRFGGNREAARREHTGCVTCLESCWVAVTSNDRYPAISTLRRRFFPNSRFKGKGALLPGDGRPVIVIYRLIPSGRLAGTP